MTQPLSFTSAPSKRSSIEPLGVGVYDGGWLSITLPREIPSPHDVLLCALDGSSGLDK